MNWQQLWTNYKDLVVVVATALATLAATRILPWIWQNVVAQSWNWTAKHVSHRWRVGSFRRDYLNWLIEEHRYLEIHGVRTRAPVSIELEDIYVPLRAKASLHRETDSGRTPNSKSEREWEIVTVTKALADHRRIVILGDPGSGKTTLLRFMAVTFGRLLRGDRSKGDNPNRLKRRLGPDWILKTGLLKFRKAEETPLPLLIPLRSLHLENLKGTLDLASLCVGRYLQDSCPEDFWETMLREGKCIILLDGLDEVRGSEGRRQVVEWIEDLVASYPENRYVVTSRTVGYSTPIASGFVAMALEDFSDEDIERFVHQWYWTVEVIGRGESVSVQRQARQRADTLVKTILENQQVRRLAVNPLLLSIIALVHRYRAKLPERRVDLYDECTLVLLGHWDEAKGIAGDLPPTQKRLVLEPIALQMQNGKSQDLTRDQVEAILGDELPKVGGTKHDARQFLDEIRERSGLLIERAPDVFAFSHLTFQEYLAARQIARASQERLLFDHITDDQWREVVLLYNGIQDATSFVLKLLDGPDDIFHSRLLFAGQCVAEAMAVDEDLRHQVTARLQDLVIISDFKACRNAAAQDLRSLAPRPTVDYLAEKYRKDQEPARRRAAETLSYLVDYAPESICLELLGDDDKETRKKTLISLSEHGAVDDTVAKAILDRLGDEDPSVRRVAIAALQGVTFPFVFNSLVDRLLTDSNWMVREAAAIVIGTHEHPLVFAYLGLAMSDSSGDVVIEADESVWRVFRGLSWRDRFRFLFSSSLELARKVFQEPYRQRAFLAIAIEVGYISALLCSAPADILGLSRREGWLARGIRSLYWGWSWLVATLSQPLLNWLLSSESESRFWTSLYRSLMAYTVGDRRVIVLVRPFLTSENPRDQEILLRGIYTTGISDPILEECLRKAMIETQSQNVRWLAAYRLYNFDPKLALSTFVAQIQEESSPELRSTALNALLLARSHLDDNHLSLIRKTLDDTSPIVRDMACFVLGRLRDKYSVRPLCRLIRDEEPSVRASACEALAEISSPESVNYLQPLLTDQDESVRNASYDALWRICRQTGIELLPS